MIPSYLPHHYCHIVLGLSYRLLLTLCVVLSPLTWAQAPASADSTVNLGTTIQGNQEQPKVLYIVPWASASGPGDLDPLARQGNNVFQRVFAPVERIELRRQLHYLKESAQTEAPK